MQFHQGVGDAPEEMLVYNNSRMRIEVTFRIAARGLIIPGVRRVRRDADGNSRVTLERIIRPTYFVEFEDTQAVIPAKDAEDPVLRVEGVLSNRSNTYRTFASGSRWQTFLVMSGHGKNRNQLGRLRGIPAVDVRQLHV